VRGPRRRPSTEHRAEAVTAILSRQREHSLAKNGTITIRLERPEDSAAVISINDRAFAGTDESGLVEAIKQSGRPVISLIACFDDTPAGHIFFSPVQILSEGPMIATLALAPMAVLPAFQRRGIGTLLVEAGLKECARLGCQVVVVVGHPTFYSRFGFCPADRMGLQSIYSSAGDAFMAIELSKAVLAGRTWFVEYPVEFADV
jgi:putative acetyltransferase